MKNRWLIWNDGWCWILIDGHWAPGNALITWRSAVEFAARHGLELSTRPLASFFTGEARRVRSSRQHHTPSGLRTTGIL